MTGVVTTIRLHGWLHCERCSNDRQVATLITVAVVVEVPTKSIMTLRYDIVGL